MSKNKRFEKSDYDTLKTKFMQRHRFPKTFVFEQKIVKPSSKALKPILHGGVESAHRVEIEDCMLVLKVMMLIFRDFILNDKHFHLAF